MRFLLFQEITNTFLLLGLPGWLLVDELKLPQTWSNSIKIFLFNFFYFDLQLAKLISSETLEFLSWAQIHFRFTFNLLYTLTNWTCSNFWSYMHASSANCQACALIIILRNNDPFSFLRHSFSFFIVFRGLLDETSCFSGAPAASLFYSHSHCTYLGNWIC